MNRRHRFFWSLLRGPVAVFLRLRLGYTYKKAENLPAQYMVIANHATNYDPLLVGVSFKQMYFVASEHIARWKVAFKFLKFAFDPIIRRKGTVAASTTLELMRHIKKGHNVSLFAEGVRTWDGVTAPLHPSTAKFIKHAGCGLVTYRISGGYFVSPMWSTGKPRRGPLHGEPVNVYTAEQLGWMSVEDIQEAIDRDLYEDAYARQAVADAAYKGKHLAEGFENLLFICPSCGKYDTFISKDDTARCTACDQPIRYDEKGYLHGIRFKTVKELSDYQKTLVAEDFAENRPYTATSATLTRIVKHQEEAVDEGELTMTADSLTVGNTVFAMADITDMAIHGSRSLVFSVNKAYYELKPSIGNNAWKFLLYYDASHHRVLERKV